MIALQGGHPFAGRKFKGVGIKKGEKVLVICCETAGKALGKNAVGDEVCLGLYETLHPGKIVIAGNNKIAGEFYFPKLISDDSTIPYVRMYT